MGSFLISRHINCCCSLPCEQTVRPSRSRAATDCGGAWVHMCPNCGPTGTSRNSRSFFFSKKNCCRWRGLVPVQDCWLGICVFLVWTQWYRVLPWLITLRSPSRKDKSRWRRQRAHLGRFVGGVIRSSKFMFLTTFMCACMTHSSGSTPSITTMLQPGTRIHKKSTN